MGQEKILLDHGSGGKKSHQIVSGLILKYFNNPILAELDDSAVLEMNSGRIAFSTDSYTVDPIFFPGGDIGDLAINGTVNDLAMRGAQPLYLSVGLILEEGFPLTDLERILESMQHAAEFAGVLVVTGDTKVVPRGAADKIFINTSGIGALRAGIHLSASNARPGDLILLNGGIAEHGTTVLTQREGLQFESALKSDTAALNHLVQKMVAVSGQIHTLRDPTRGGLGTTLNEIALQSRVGIKINETAIPLRDDVRGACEILGLDPLYLANEGKLIACVGAEDAEKILVEMRSESTGRGACVIGEITVENPGRVVLQTAIGSRRIIDMLTGEQLPRIC
jgi:hydrogenase expression/formation protein HypE